MEFLGTDEDEFVQFFKAERKGERALVWAYWKRHANERARELLSSTQVVVTDELRRYTLSLEQCVIRPGTRVACIVGYLTDLQ